jgi:hypothetical protein
MPLGKVRVEFRRMIMNMKTPKHIARLKKLFSAHREPSAKQTSRELERVNPPVREAERL